MRYSVEEYFRLERNSAQKHEFRHGEILDMAGGGLPSMASSLQTLLENRDID